MANLVLAFAEILVGAMVLDAGVKGDSIANVVQGKATQHPLPGGETASAAGAASPSAGPGGGGSGSYVNPLPGASASRVDQGVDYTITQPVLAPGNLLIKHIGNVQGFGTYIAGQLTDGPLAGHGIYFAEGLAPAPGVTVGQLVAAGQPVAEPAAGPYGHGVIEAGWADTSSSWYAPLAQSTGGYSEGASTAAGASFNRFVQALGGPLGHLAGSILGHLQAGLP